ncbi:structural protein [Synechococcus phage S-RS29]|nr:structural protein [Synechococcus phage S-RS29]
MANRIQLRRGGAQEWANANPTLAQGELGIELDTGRIKIGDGVSAWNTLRYERPVESTTNTANTLVQRDADGNFSAGTITATLTGNAATATRLSQSRQISIDTDITASANFDGSQNITLNAQLGLISTLPHYDGTNVPTGTYTKVQVDSKGRVINATALSAMTLAEYGLDGTVEGASAQPYDNDLAAIAGLLTTGYITRTGNGNIFTREVIGQAGQIVITDGKGLTGNTNVDLATTTVVAGDYNTESLTSVSALGANNEPFGTETVNATKFTVDDRGRLQSATNVPIATATEGSKYASYDAGTTYSRYDIIEEGGNVYQALATIAAGGGAPSHTSGDTGQWRYLAAAATEQKGLASFAQEDFDVDNNGHVTIAALGVDNTQLQNNRISFADGNTKEDFELDQELTSTTGYRGFNYLNYVKVNDTSGNLLFGANNTGDSGAGEIDVNVRSYFSDPDITLDGAVAQTLDKSGDGNLTFSLTQNSASARNLSIISTNAGSGTSTVTISAEDVIDIDTTDANGKVHVEDLRIQANYLASTGQLNLDPGDDRAATGLVRIFGNLQIDGTTTTVNSTELTVDDVTLLLGGDTAPTSDDNLDRGLQFRYYDTQARLGFYGWDTNYTDLGGHEGGYRFLHAATNTSEVFTGTDSGIIAGNVKLTTNTNSTSNTTGDLVVAGGAGIGQDVNIGGLLDVDGTFRANSTSRFDDNIVLQGASKTLQLNNGSGTTKIEFQSTTGNASIGGVTDVTGNFNVNTNKFNVVAASGNTTVAGTLGVTGATTLTGALDLNNTLNVSGDIHLESTNDITVAKNATTGVWEIQSNDYGALRLDGGAYVAGDALVDGTLHVNGAIEVKDSATEAESRLNWLRVRYRGRFGDSYGATPSYASHNTTTIRAHGGAGVEKTLHVGATGSGEGLFVGKRYSGDTVKFSVLGASGNTDIQGTLDVAGNSEFNGTVDVDADFAVRSGTTDKFFVDNVTGNTDIQGTLDVNGATEITNTLDVSNAVTFDSTLTVDGETNITDTLNVSANGEYFRVRNGNNANKFTVDTDNGNTEVYGTLDVSGNSEFNGTVDVDADFAVRNGTTDKFFVDNVTGNTNIIGTLTVGDATQINDTFGASGIVTLTNNTDQTLTGNYGADGALRLTGGAAIQRNLAVGGNMRVYGDFEITGSTTQSGNTGFSGRVDVTNTSDATSFADNSVALTTDGGFRVSKNAWVGGDFYVWDDANSRNAFYVDTSTGDATLHNTLTVGGNLVVNGTTTTVNSTVTTLDDPIITLGGDTAPASNDGKDRGVEFRYYDGTAKIGFFGFDRSANQFSFLVDATNTAEVHSGTDAALRAGSLNLTAAGTALDVDNDANIDGALTVDGQIVSNKASGAPFSIASTTKVANLNVDLLDGMTTASANTASTVVNRDSSGDFAANIITVASGIGAAAGIQGNALTADTLKTARTITIDGVVDGSVSFNGSADVTISTTYNDADITALAAMAGTGFVSRTAANTYAQRTLQVTASSGITLTNADGVSGDPTINVASSSTNSANNLVIRDASGNFAAGTITADLTGDVTGDLTGNASNATAVSTGSGGGTTLYLAQFNGVGATSGRTIYSNSNVVLTYSNPDWTLTVDKVAADLTGNVTGNADTATTLATARNFTTSGDATAPAVSFDGSGNVDLVLTLADSGVVAGTVGASNLIPRITVDSKGRVTSITQNALAIIQDTTPELGGDLDLNSNDVTGTGNINITGTVTATSFSGPITGNVTGTVSDISNHDTDALSEGSTNLYYTTTRANTDFDTKLAAADTDDLSEGSTNLYYTDARADARIAAADTDALSEGAVNLYFTDARADARIAAATTDDLSEGSTNQYYTEARVQAKLDNAFAQLQAMLNNLATTTTLVLNLSGDPTPGAVVTTTVANGGGGGFSAGTAVATTGGTGSSLTVDTTVVGGVITAAAVNAGGSDYLVNETVTITNPNAGKVLSLNLASLAGGSNYVTGTALATTGGSGSASLTVDITAVGGAITNVTINDGGTGYVAGETITIVQATGADGTNPGAGGTVDISTVTTDATLTLTDVTTMEVGATVTGATSGTTGVITALGTNQITVDTVDGFFKVGEIVSANDVTTLTISSFA